MIIYLTVTEPPTGSAHAAGLVCFSPLWFNPHFCCYIQYIRDVECVAPTRQRPDTSKHIVKVPI